MSLKLNQETTVMNTAANLVCCSHCGDEDLLPDELLHVDAGTLCPFCEHMYYEAQEIFESSVKNKRPTIYAV